VITWPTEGKENSEGTIRTAFEAASHHNIGFLVVASVTGWTALRALSLQPAESSVQIVCIGQQVGYSADGLDDMPLENYRALAAAGVPVFKGMHGLAGPSRAIRYAWQGVYPPELIAHTLRLFGQGAKACVEAAMMALDAGLIPFGEDVIALGGTSRGADTAMIIRPAHSQKFFETKVRAILCKPWLD
jgi:hypothetical protein